MQDLLVASEVPVAPGIEPVPKVIPPRVPGNYRQRLQNKLHNIGALAGRRGGRKSVGIPAVYLEDPQNEGAFVRVLAVTLERARTLDTSELGQIKKEAAIAKRNRRGRKRIDDAFSGGWEMPLSDFVKISEAS